MDGDVDANVADDMDNDIVLMMMYLLTWTLTFHS